MISQFEDKSGALTEAIVTQHSSLSGVQQQLAEIYYIVGAQQLEGYGQVHLSVTLPACLMFLVLRSVSSARTRKVPRCYWEPASLASVSGEAMDSSPRDSSGSISPISSTTRDTSVLSASTSSSESPVFSSSLMTLKPPNTCGKCVFFR